MHKGCTCACPAARIVKKKTEGIGRRQGELLKAKRKVVVAGAQAIRPLGHRSHRAAIAGWEPWDWERKRG